MPKDNLEFANAKDCEQLGDDKEAIEDEEERRKLAEVKEEADIDMADIDALTELSEEQRQKKKDKRVALFKSMQNEAQKNSRLTKKDEAVDMEPIK